ncbi:hypothetical protein T492DRAFT_862009 [Pavlovales sp. CCMP2436]|nr:hypothetical protein T492DRAFT_862009 [Pavlovales sp. CCMP2436]
MYRGTATRPGVSAAGAKRKGVKRKGAKRKGKSRRTREPATTEALLQAVYHVDELSDYEWVDGVPGSDEHFLDGLSDSGEVIDIGDDEDEATTPKATYADVRVVVFALEIVDGENDGASRGFDEQLPTLLDCMHELLLPYEDTTLVTATAVRVLARRGHRPPI